MANDINTVIVSGRFTREPECMRSQSGNVVANFDLAIDMSGKQGKAATFIKFVAFGKTAEIIEKYVGKGQRVLIRGYIKQDVYEKDGKKNYAVKVYCDQVILLEKGKAGQTTATADFMSIPDGLEEDLPFN